MGVVLDAARETVQHTWIMAAMTVFFTTTFVGWTAWAWAPSNKLKLDRAAHLPLEEA